MRKKGCELFADNLANVFNNVKTGVYGLKSINDISQGCFIN